MIQAVVGLVYNVYFLKCSDFKISKIIIKFEIDKHPHQYEARYGLGGATPPPQTKI